MQLVSYFKSVAKESKNISFPTRQDVRITSVVVVIMVLVLMVFISFTDFLISKLIRILLGIL